MMPTGTQRWDSQTPITHIKGPVAVINCSLIIQAPLPVPHVLTILLCTGKRQHAHDRDANWAFY
jgi:hypothetical protein